MRFEFSPKNKQPAEEETEVIDEGKRSSLKKIASVAAAAVVGTPVLSALEGFEAKAATANETDSATTVEKIRNLVAIKAYEEQLQKGRSLLESDDFSFQNLRNIREILFSNLPQLDRESLRGTRYDHEAWFREIGWPAVQLTGGAEEDFSKIRFAEQENLDILNYKNGFFAGAEPMLITNKHKTKTSPIPEDGHDVAGYFYENQNKDPQIEALIMRTKLDWDRRKAKEDMYGKFVHIPSIHEQRGEGPHDTDIVSGTLFPITPAVIQALRMTSENDQQFAAMYENSYGMIVNPRDTNKDGRESARDIDGISGSPVFSQEDSMQGIQMPSGILWGSNSRLHRETGLLHTIVFVHGPDVLGAEIDEMNTVVSGEMNEEQFPDKRERTAKVQTLLQNIGYEIAVDGAFGGQTQDLVFDFQKRVFDEQTMYSEIQWGVVDRKTFRALVEIERAIRNR